MHVILLQDIKGTGRTGDVKDVAPGYARNFLFKHALAKPATEAAVRQLHMQEEKQKKKVFSSSNLLYQISAFTYLQILY